MLSLRGHAVEKALQKARERLDYFGTKFFAMTKRERLLFVGESPGKQRENLKFQRY